MKSRVSATSRDGEEPHVTMQAIDGSVHVFPVAMIENIIGGTLPLAQVDSGDLIVKTIMREWLDGLMRERILR